MPRVNLRRVNLQKTLFILPNLFTLSSIFCGFQSILWSAGLMGEDLTRSETLWKAALAIVFAMFFDIADGRVARLTKTQSALGVQLDSLADAISFGVAPALLVYRWGLFGMGKVGALIAFIFLACGVIRLARFNVMAAKDGGASHYSLGIPIPLAAACIVSLVIAQQGAPTQLAHSPLLQQGVIAALVLLLSYVMVSTIRFRTFKDLFYSKRSALLFVGGSAFSFAISWALLGPQAGWVLLAVSSYTYILLGFVEAAFSFGVKRRDERKSRETGDIPPSRQE
jgi:CDP-diacylglycerol---serine O-phosphatidyltransferase